MILTTMSEHGALLAAAHSVAMVGASNNPGRPSYLVFRYLRTHGGFDVAPINPTIVAIDGVRAYPTLAAYRAEHGPPDIVNVFRKPAEALGVARAAVAVGAKAIWFQYGVMNDDAIALADAAGLDVVVDRCIKVEAARFNGGLAIGGLHGDPIPSRPRSV